MDATDQFAALALSYLVPFAVVPLVGAALLLLGFKIAKLPERPYVQCWKVFITAYVCGILAVVLVTLCQRWIGLDGWAKLTTELATSCAMQVLVILLMLGERTGRAFGVTAITVLVTNLAAFTLSLVFRGL